MKTVALRFYSDKINKHEFFKVTGKKRNFKKDDLEITPEEIERDDESDNGPGKK